MTYGVTDVVTHKIITEPGKGPIKSQPYRSTPHEKNIMQQVNEQLKADLIKKNTSPWASLIVLVEKKSSDINDINSCRCTVDYRKLNSITKPTS